MSTLKLPHNLTGLDYRQIPARKVKVAGGIIDAHMHAGKMEHMATFVDAAVAYGVGEIWTMCGLEHAPALAERWPGLFHFIATPAWQNASATQEFADDWIRRVDAFYALGSRLIKFHLAPGTKKKWMMNAEHPIVQRVAKHAHELGFHLMTHIGDPLAWFCGSGKYADGSFGIFEEQFAEARAVTDIFADRTHLGAHMGGCLEDLEALTQRMDANPRYVIDTSATKWIVRAVAEQSPQAVRDFVVAYQDRILFGSDLVVGERYDWDHYASRYYAHLKLWETDTRELAAIEDPDAGKGFDPRARAFDTARADGIARLVGVNLPEEVLVKVYRENALRWLPRVG